MSNERFEEIRAKAAALRDADRKNDSAHHLNESQEADKLTVFASVDDLIEEALLENPD